MIEYKKQLIIERKNMNVFKEIVTKAFNNYNGGVDSLVRTSNHRSLKVDDESYIVYNTKLNCPVYLQREALEWFLLHKHITEDIFEKLDNDGKEVVECLIESYLYFPPNINEQFICDQQNKSYMYEFEKGKTFEWLDLRISEACNFGCPHCIAKDAQNSRLMTFEKAIELIKNFVHFKIDSDENFNILKIHFGNCEPLLNAKTICKIVDYVNKHYSEYIKEYSINTNLTLLDKETAEFFMKNNVEIYTSLDGPEKANDSIRIYKNGNGTYHDIITKMKMLEEMGNPIRGISVTITNKNFSFLDEEFIEWCEKQNFQSVAYDFDLINSTNIPIEEKAKFLCSTWQEFSKKGIEFYGTWMTPFINISNYSVVEEPYAFCKAMFGKNISVDIFGNIFACSYSNKAICTFDNLKEAIKPNKEYYNLVKNHLVGSIIYHECQGCIYEGACNGQCNQTRMCADEQMIQKQCDYYKVVTDTMLIAQAKMLKKEVEKDESNKNA